MDSQFLLKGLLLVLSFWLLACSPRGNDIYNPNIFPYKFKKIKTIGAKAAIKPVDLNSDGRDEFVTWGNDKASATDAILLYSHELFTIDEANYTGKILEPQALDLNHDGMQEIAVPFVRNDSLFVSFINDKAQKLFFIFLIKGKPRKDKDSLISWDPGVKAFFLVDVNNDGVEELITLFNTQRAAMPRGILVHTLPEGRLLDSLIIGSPPNRYLKIEDFDKDGQLELIMGTPAPYNHAVAGGFSDEFSYIIVTGLTLPIEVEWFKNLGRLWSVPDLFYEDWNGDGRKEFLIFRSSQSSRPEGTCLQFLKPGTWEMSRAVTLNELLQNAVVMDLNQDGLPEILATRNMNELWVLDNKLDKLQQIRFPFEFRDLTLIKDIDADGREEIFAGTEKGTFMLDPSLRLTAFLPDIGVQETISRGLGKPPYLLCRSPESFLIMQRVENRFYLYFRYRKSLFWLLGSTAGALMLLFVFSLHRRMRLLRTFQELVMETDARGLIFLDAAGYVQTANAAARSWLNLPTGKAVQKIKLADHITISAMRQFLRQAMTLPAHQHETRLPIKSKGQDLPMRVIVEPVVIPGKSVPCWLVSLIDLSREAELQQAKTWSIMAQRVAHDIKNPLTSILLTLQRLQMEYRHDEPQQSEKYNRYTYRIMERIESLRRMTRTFMKFINLEKPNFTETDINELIEQICQKILKGLPPDIELNLKLALRLKPVRVDQEQIQIVIENLVANAVNAMPEGGKMTVTTTLQQNLQPHGHSKSPQDFVVLEIMDTGKGIPESDLGRIFEPDFTATEGGSGLGLAMVKKIVEEHNGYIEVESEVGVGSAFSVFLPVK